MKLPFFQFYPADWLMKTRPLCLATKGAWIDILCVLHGSATRGSVTMSVVGWARVIGASVDQAEAVMIELADTRVADIARTSGNGDVTVTSRRMCKDRWTREQTRQRVAKHRNTRGDAARKPNGNKPEDTPGNAQSNAKVTDIDQRIEDRGQSNTLGKRSAAASPTSDSDFLESLRLNPAYAGIDVQREFQKMTIWCAANRKGPTRRRLVNWLNRVEKPMQGKQSPFQFREDPPEDPPEEPPVPKS